MHAYQQLVQKRLGGIQYELLEKFEEQEGDVEVEGDGCGMEVFVAMIEATW